MALGNNCNFRDFRTHVGCQQEPAVDIKTRMLRFFASTKKRLMKQTPKDVLDSLLNGI